MEESQKPTRPEPPLVLNPGEAEALAIESQGRDDSQQAPGVTLDEATLTEALGGDLSEDSIEDRVEAVVDAQDQAGTEEEPR
jgi:hypothetical protein